MADSEKRLPIFLAKTVLPVQENPEMIINVGFIKALLPSVSLSNLVLQNTLYRHREINS